MLKFYGIVYVFKELDGKDIYVKELNSCIKELFFFGNCKYCMNFIK